jgi:hypothetical protein
MVIRFDTWKMGRYGVGRSGSVWGLDKRTLVGTIMNLVDSLNVVKIIQ